MLVGNVTPLRRRILRRASQILQSTARRFHYSIIIHYLFFFQILYIEEIERFICSYCVKMLKLLEEEGNYMYRKIDFLVMILDILLLIN